MAERDETTEAPEDEGDLTGATKREGQAPSSKSVRIRKSEAQLQLGRGTLVGRYVLLDKLGEGGMGVVYGAFDPELDRKVAIKVLQAEDSSHGSSGSGSQAWLIREAQALARLAHPNVVAVHDVGTLPGERVFVAMELVDGMTMRQWLKEKARSWREVVPVMVAAGQGLAAAHDVGLVHRDFKPENVLVGNDGRVRVMDFGLARLRVDDDLDSGRSARDLASVSGRSRRSSFDSSKSPLSAELTEAGHVVGTAAYMAPEIYELGTADARTDQFAFGVTLFEGLYHQRPFDKKELMPSRSAPPRVKLPADAKVPPHLQRITLRALAISPNERFPTMHALLVELGRDPLAARRRAFVAVAATLAVGGLAVGGYAALRHHDELCSGADRRLAGVWDAPIKDQIHAAFTRSKQAFAERSFAGLSRALDDYTGKWQSAVTDTCQATRVRGEQTEEVMTLRQSCLDQRLEELRALTKILVDADPGLVEKGDKVAFGLEPLASCANVALLRSPGLPPPELKPKVAELEKLMANARAQVIAANYLAGLTATQQLIDQGRALPWEPLVAEALSVRGAALIAVGNADDATVAFSDGTWAAIRGKRDDIAAHAAFMVAMMTSDFRGKPDEAKLWLDMGTALASRVGVDHQLESHHYEVAGMVAAESGDLNAAVPLFEKAFAAAILTFGNRDNPGLSAVESDFGTTLSKAGAYGLAIPHYEHALALRIVSVGEEHPDIALMMSNLGLCYGHVGELAKGRDTLTRALAMREKLFGKNSPLLVATLDNLAELIMKQGDGATAEAMMERAEKLAQVIPGPSHPSFHTLLTDRAAILIEVGKLADARAVLDRALELEQQNKSNIVPLTQTMRARLALAEHKWSDAESFAQQAIAGYEAQGGKDQPELWKPLAEAARAKIGAGDAAAARPLLERAIAVAQKANVTEYDLKPVRDLLATAKQ